MFLINIAFIFFLAHLVRINVEASLEPLISSSKIGKIFGSSFLINIFRDTNVARIFYKSSQIYGTYTTGDS